MTFGWQDSALSQFCLDGAKWMQVWVLSVGVLGHALGSRSSHYPICWSPPEILSEIGWKMHFTFVSSSLRFKKCSMQSLKQVSKDSTNTSQRGHISYTVRLAWFFLRKNKTHKRTTFWSKLRAPRQPFLIISFCGRVSEHSVCNQGFRTDLASLLMHLSYIFTVTSAFWMRGLNPVESSWIPETKVKHWGCIKGRNFY